MGPCQRPCSIVVTSVLWAPISYLTFRWYLLGCRLGGHYLGLYTCMLIYTCVSMYKMNIGCAYGKGLIHDRTRLHGHSDRKCPKFQRLALCIVCKYVPRKPSYEVRASVRKQNGLDVRQDSQRWPHAQACKSRPCAKSYSDSCYVAPHPGP